MSLMYWLLLYVVGLIVVLNVIYSPGGRCLFPYLVPIHTLKLKNLCIELVLVAFLYPFVFVFMLCLLLFEFVLWVIDKNGK